MGSVVIPLKKGAKAVDIVKSLMSSRAEVVASKSVGGVLYMALRMEPGRRVVGAVALIRRFPAAGEVEVKVMGEEENPFYYDCPSEVLGVLGPSDDARALAWRARCAERNFKKASPLMPNDKIELSGRRYVVLGKAGGRYGYLIRAEDGKLFRLPLNRRADCNIVA